MHLQGFLHPQLQQEAKSENRTNGAKAKNRGKAKRLPARKYNVNQAPKVKAMILLVLQLDQLKLTLL
jgi:hypothetical protein